MEVSVAMVKNEERNRNNASNTQSQQIKKLKRLQAAVICCILGMCMLTALTLYSTAFIFMLNKDNKALIQTTNEIALAYKNPDMTHNNVEKPRAHLTGTKQDYSSQQNQTLQWEHYRGLAFTEFGMNYSNRSLHIPKTGYYYIYAQVSFRSVGYECSANDQKASRKKYISQMIAKINDNYPEPEVLLSGTKSLCEKESEVHHPIYLGALLYMMEGDQIMVNVSDIKLVDVTVEHRTYFGAFLV